MNADSSQPPPCILVVEDNRVHREVACAVLHKHGYHVIQARDGEEALDRLQYQTCSLILMDLELPWMNGIRAAEEIGEWIKNGVLPNIPVVALTADYSEETHDRCLRAGMRDVIPKHIWKPKWEQLIMDRLKEWLA